MKNIPLILLITISTISCTDFKWNGKWEDCDELCIVYYSAQKKLMKERELYDRDFPSKEERRQHITKTETGHKIKSWFQSIKNTDTSTIQFSCEVLFDKEKKGTRSII
ncbi:hypothetical protein [Flammeovirga sp. SJP92]|uniref:hypothetical protein n=1 Tax=Flammeovirga sp. SJP92 TaxID=1775430 RepID=UPI000786910A|nr:hypothetical protein [Flammeovirga sp. SJP92]KXX66500.1 hypothetical protein AVL50_31735 [Flammeovirga sp. SJP92]